MKNKYSSYVREQLKITKTQVRRWKDWNPDDVYQAFYEARQVIIPKPVCDWSFLVALHEIGHISTGPRLYSHLAEYNAEQWALKRASSVYDVVCPAYEEDAKIYVTNHLLTDVVCFGYSIHKIKPYVLKWLGITSTKLLNLISTKVLEECIHSINLHKETIKALKCHEKSIQSPF